MAINTLFENIADAIREKAGASGLITPAQMPQAIADIPSGGVEILSGVSSPTSLQGDNGQLYLQYDGGTPMGTNLLANYQDIADWTKNQAAFTVHSVEYEDGISVLTHQGGSGYERIFVPVNVAQNTDYTFIIQYYTETSISYGYGGQIAIAVATENQAQTGGSGSYANLGKVDLNRNISDTFATYFINFNSGSYSTLYPLIDLNIQDGQTNVLVFKNLYFVEGTKTEITDPGRIKKAFAKASNAWVDLYDAYISDIITS